MINLKFFMEREDELHLTIHDLNGNQVVSTLFFGKAGDNELSVYLKTAYGENLHRGVYKYLLRNGKRYTGTIVIR